MSNEQILETIEINNFQSHKHTILNLSPGINVIIGKSNVGKSSIIRALRWLTFYEPPGFKFRSRFADKKELTEVKITFLDGMKVSLSRDGLTSSKAIYKLNNEEFSGFRTEVPEEVKGALNLAEINFQSQLQPHFLLSVSPPEIARVINKIIQVEEVDDWVSDITSSINTFNRNIDDFKERQKEIEIKLEKLDFLSNLEEDLIIIEEIKTRLDQTKNELENGRNILDRLEAVSGKKKRLSDILGVEKHIKTAGNKQYNLDRAKLLLTILYKIIQLKKVQEQEKEFISFVEPRFIEINETAKQYRKAQKNISIMYSLKNQFNRIFRTIGDATVKYNVTMEHYKIKIKEIGICPFCKSELDDIRISQMMEDL